MEKKYISIFKRSVWGVAAIIGCSACTDTIDEHYQVSDGVPTKTLWEQIIEQPNLTQFAKVLENVHYYNNGSETKPSSLTYKDLLQQNNKMTVWAPVDGTFDLDAVMADIQNDEYSVGQRFVKNYVNTFSKSVSGSENDSITMLNSKMNVLDNEGKTFKGVDIVESNISASNGILHKLNSTITFLNNLYEYMQVTPEVSSLYKYFHDRDTTYLDENQSVQGGINEEGEITWADSVMVTDSKAFNFSYSYRGMNWSGLNATLTDEDSTYVMIMPTNTGWNKAMAKMLPKYKYMSLPYANKDNKLSEPTTVNPDTLQKFMAEGAVVNRLVFSPNMQKDYTLEDFGHTDSLITTNYAIIDTPYCNNIFKGLEPIALSNGYVYLTDDYLYSTASDIEIEGEDASYLYKDGMNIASGAKTAVVSKENRNQRIEGVVSNGAYIYTTSTNKTSASNISFKLPNILSTKYDVYAVILPENIRDSLNLNPLELKFSATMNFDDGISTDGVSKKSEVFINDTSKVDTVLLFKDFEFPIAYQNVTGAYPTLTLKVEANFIELKNGTYSNSICVDKIILRAKEED